MINVFFVGAVSGLEERLGDLHVSMSANHDSELERTDTDSISDSFEADGLPSAFEAYIKGMVGIILDLKIKWIQLSLNLYSYSYCQCNMIV